MYCATAPPSVFADLEDRAQWMQKIHEAQSKRTPEALEAARSRMERARQHEVSARKCKAVKGNTLRSRALAAEALNQMTTCSSPDEHLAVQARWRSAQESSYRHQEETMTRASAALDCGRSRRSAAVVLRSADEDEAAAMEDVTMTMGSVDVQRMMSMAAEGLGAPASVEAASVAPPATSTVDNLLKQLRREPNDEAECAAKFLLYEGYNSEVEKMRETLLNFHEETTSTVPAAIAFDMNKQIKDIDSTEAMGIPENAREWFVFHMMRTAERNNLKMAGILEGFEKKLEFLASSDQSECPVCLEDFASEGNHVPETLGCCHKVCKECWIHWSSVMGGNPFCPMCRQDEFLGAVAARDVQ